MSSLPAAKAPASLPVTLMETEYASLWLYPDAGILHHKIHGSMPPGAAQKLFAASLAHRENQLAWKWLFDDRENARIGETLAQWGRFARQAGLVCWAIVLPTSTIGKMQTLRFVDEALGLGVLVKAFRHDDEALCWLESLDKDQT